MPELNGVEVTKQIRRSLPASILIVTMYDSERMARAAIEAGASGYLSKADAGQVLIEAVHALLGNQTFVSERLHLAEDIVSSKPGPPTTPVGVADAARARSAAAARRRANRTRKWRWRCDISPKTVETHRARIFAKLHLHSMNELVRYAIRNQVIEP